MKVTREKLKSDAGITLVALVVTMIVLVILASISIGAIFSEKGIIQQAKDAKKTHEDARKLEEENLNDLLGEYKNSMDGIGSSGSGGDNVTTPTPTPTPEVPKGPNGNQLVTSITDTDHDTIEGEDDKGNKVVVPGGFKIAEDSGSSIKEGIVVEDSLGNQFVWIPVSNINHDGSNKIKIDDKDEVGTEITLGRYTFSTSSPRKRNSSTICKHICYCYYSRKKLSRTSNSKRKYIYINEYNSKRFKGIRGKCRKKPWIFYSKV